MKRLAAGLLIASLFLVGCGEPKKTGGAKTEPAKTAAKTEAEKTK
jgi:hypothetical protein